MAQFGANKSGFFSTSSSSGGVPPPIVDFQDAVDNGNINILTWSLNTVLNSKTQPYIEFNPTLSTLNISSGTNLYAPSGSEDYVKFNLDGSNTNVTLFKESGLQGAAEINSDSIVFKNFDSNMTLQKGISQNDYVAKLPAPFGGNLSLQETNYAGIIDLSTSNYPLSAYENSIFRILNGGNEIQLSTAIIQPFIKIYFLNQAPITNAPYTDAIVTPISVGSNLYGEGANGLPQGLCLLMRYGNDFYINQLAQF